MASTETARRDERNLLNGTSNIPPSTFNNQSLSYILFNSLITIGYTSYRFIPNVGLVTNKRRVDKIVLCKLQCNTVDVQFHT